MKTGLTGSKQVEKIEIRLRRLKLEFLFLKDQDVFRPKKVEITSESVKI